MTRLLCAALLAAGREDASLVEQHAGEQPPPPAAQWEDPDVVEQRAREHGPAPEPETPPLLALDVYPLAAALPVLAGFIHLPVAAVVPFGERYALSLELSLTHHRSHGTDGLAGQGSVGVQVGFGRTALRGFYLGPKVGLLVVRPVQLLDPSTERGLPTTYRAGPLDLGPGVTRAFLCGVDAGWQWRTGRLHFALGVGFSAGYGYDVGSPFVSPFQMTAASGRQQGFAFSVDLGVLRVGLVL